MSYQAEVCAIKVKPHPNADRLQLGIVNGVQVIVGLNVTDGQLGLFFPSDGQLSEEFATANDLVQRIDSVTGKKAGGFFAKNRRVRSQNLRGEKSYPFKFFVYRISMVNEGGYEVDLCFDDMCRRALELGLKTVPKLCTYHSEFTNKAAFDAKWIEDNYLDTPSLLDSNHIKEGVVMRIESSDCPLTFVKYKSHEFGVLEGYLKDDDSYVDREEIS